MANYPINKTILLSKFPKVTVKITGNIKVDYPNASVNVRAKATGTSAHPYNLSIGPNKLKDQQTQKFTITNIPITVVLDARPDEGVVYASVKKGDFVFWTLPVSYTQHKGIHTITAYGLYAVIKALEGKADHTYVIGVDKKTGHQLVWNCGGAYEGGRQLTTGEADGMTCDCISLRMEDIKLAGGMAGIRYGIDGVCHQAANRIMYPAGLVVNKANGWKLSSKMYGRLGLRAIDGKGKALWEKILKRCMGVTAEIPTEHLLSETPDPINEHLIELEHDLLEETGIRFSTAQSKDLSSEFLMFQESQQRLGSEIGKGNITGVSFAMDMNNAISKYVANVSKIASGPVQEKLFGQKEDTPIYLINPDIAEQIYSQEALTE